MGLLVEQTSHLLSSQCHAHGVHPRTGQLTTDQPSGKNTVCSVVFLWCSLASLGIQRTYEAMPRTTMKAKELRGRRSACIGRTEEASGETEVSAQVQTMANVLGTQGKGVLGLCHGVSTRLQAITLQAVTHWYCVAYSTM